MSRAAIAALLAIAACGDDGDLTPEPLPGAPAAVRALLAAGDDVIVIGGSSAFGLQQLQRYRDGRWTVAPGVPPFGASATLIEGDAVYAASETALYRLEDVDTFRWSDARAIPAPVPAIIGAMANTIVGALPDAGGGAIVLWEPGTRIWRELARPIGNGARGFVVGDGRVTWSDPARGVVRAEIGTTAVLVDCTPEELGACALPVLPLGDADDVAVVACGTGTPPSGASRVRDGALVATALPPNLSACAGAAGNRDQAIIATLDPVAGEGELLRLTARDSSWSQISANTAGLTYAPAARAIYGFGDGISAHGVYVLSP